MNLLHHQECSCAFFSKSKKEDMTFLEYSELHEKIVNEVGSEGVSFDEHATQRTYKITDKIIGEGGNAVILLGMLILLPAYFHY